MSLNRLILWVISVVAAGLVVMIIVLLYKNYLATPQSDPVVVAQVQAQAQAECDPVKAELAAAKSVVEAGQKEIGSLKAALVAVQDENTKLKQTPRFFFDAAVTKMSESKDEEARKLFSDLASRFPDDPLALQARVNIKQIESRIQAAKEKRTRTARKYLQGLTIIAEICKTNKLTSATALYKGTGGQISLATLDKLWLDPPGNEVGQIYKKLRTDLMVKWAGHISGLKLDDKRAELGEPCYKVLGDAENRAFADCFNTGLGDLKSGGTDNEWIPLVADSGCK